MVNHTRKLLDFRGTQDFEDIELAGKCGMFLSNLATSNEQTDLNRDKVEAIAKVSNVKKTEIETVKGKLEEAKLIETARNGSLTVLGVTTSSVLSHTADIFLANEPSNFQRAAIELSDSVSELPRDGRTLTEQISDVYRLSSAETAELFRQSEELTFVDFETLDDKTKFYFNGNLFRRSDISKANAVLRSLSSGDAARISELDELLVKSGCVTKEKASAILGAQLLSKLISIAMYDFNEVSNSKETKVFVTKPAAFSKYGKPFEEDALDLAKAFVSALYYGMTFSPHSRGRITMLNRLMQRLVNGGEVGPATAIGEDYKVLELRRVIALRHEKGTSRFYMRLLKRDVGELAMQVLEFGDTSMQTLSPTVYSGSVTNYAGPEQKRVISRKTQSVQSKKQIADLIRTFRS